MWKSNIVQMNNIQVGRYSVTSAVTMQSTDTQFQLTTVYGPSRCPEKEAFLRHLQDIRPASGTKWLILGDFNLIYRVRDKNNRNLNLRLMRRFRTTLEFCEFKEIRLRNRKFTWCNERRHPTLVKLDRFFCNQEWSLCFEDHVLHALSSAHSDHCPLLLSAQVGPRKPTPFRFENIWVRLPGFHEVVSMAWNAPT